MFVESRQRAWWIPVVAVLVLAPAVVSGQQLQGSIVGRVTDESGSVLPGVTVEASSPSLQVGSVTNMTNDQGEYRLAQLPLGTYTVTYVLQGFQTFRHEGLRLTAGFVATVNAELKVGSLSETVVVSGASPVVDVRTTAVVTEFTRENLELTPTSRQGLWSLLQQMPSVRLGRLDVGGMVTNNPSGITKYGMLGEDWVTVEGVSAQQPAIDNWGGLYVDYASMEEVRAEVVGSDASQPRRGLKMSIITKSGGNDFSGAYSVGYTSSEFQSVNLSDELRAFGIGSNEKIIRRTDFSADLGGRIIRDKLWFYGAARRTNLYRIPFGATKPDGSEARLDNKLRMGTVKLSYQATPKHRFVGFYNGVAKDEWNLSQFQTWDTRANTPTRPKTSKVEWQGQFGNAAMISAQFGRWGYVIDRKAQTDQVSTFDVITMQETGANFTQRRSNLSRNHGKVSMTWYQPDLLVGSHEFKFGFEHMRSGMAFEEADRAQGNYRLVFSNGAPFQLHTVNAPVVPRNPVHTTAGYVADSWALTRRLTLNLGLRFSRDNRFLPEQCHEGGAFAAAQCFPEIQFPIWNSFSPRLHAAYDIGGNGTTVVKGGWARYAQMAGADEVILANRMAATQTNWTWRDLNGNRLYESGEVNLDPNGGDFVSLSGGGQNLLPNPDEKQPKTDEFSLALERQILPNFAVRVAGIYFRAFDRVRLLNTLRTPSDYNIPVTSRDPGPDGVANNADDPGTNITYFEFPATLAGARFIQTTYVNDPTATETFRSIDISATKRLSDRWQFRATYVGTKKNKPYLATQGGGNNYPINDWNPNGEINNSDRTYEWNAGVSGTYVWPWEVNTSMNAQMQSGRPFGRTVLARGGRTIPTQVVRVEPFGTQTLDTINILDFRVEKTITLATRHKIGLQVNVFNVLNSNTLTSASDRSGPAYLAPTGAEPVLRGRLGMFNLNYTF